MGSGRYHRGRNRGVSTPLTLCRGRPPLKTIAGLGLVLVLALSFAGCSWSALTRPDQYRVQRGDTLYSIARRHDLNWKEVARWNNISAPYTLKQGQVISLERYPDVRWPAEQQERRSGSKRSATTRAPDKPAPASKVAIAKPPARSAPKPLASDANKRWRWPSDGKLLRNYEQTRPRHGIDIGGNAGDSVIAAEGGRVVYSGAGLKGYGKLIIIKHDERFLTAYGFNRRLLVKQGDSVKAGQEIAEMGVGPRNESMLHFELRQDGEPVDPLRLLPAR